MTEPRSQTLKSRASPISAQGHFRWVILALLFGAAMINYMDRFLLGVLKPTIVEDLKWTETDYANVVFCFQLAYAIGLVTVSRMIDKLGVRFGMSLVVSMCALAAASHCLAASVIRFCIARFALGIGESGTWPGCVKAVSEWFPRKERAIGTGLVNAGSSVGATVAPLLVPLILKLVTWPFAFLFTAGLELAGKAKATVPVRLPPRIPLSLSQRKIMCTKMCTKMIKKDSAGLDRIPLDSLKIPEILAPKYSGLRAIPTLALSCSF